MFDIIKEGIKLNQSLALLPLKAARKLIGNKNTGAKQLVDVAEDVISAPFVAAATAIDNTRPHCDDKTGNEKCRSAAGGPNIKNVWVNPEVSVFSDVEINEDERRAILTVTGLLCGG